MQTFYRVGEHVCACTYQIEMSKSYYTVDKRREKTFDFWNKKSKINNFFDDHHNQSVLFGINLPAAIVVIATIDFKSFLP